jgi:hypothetical protein
LAKKNGEPLYSMIGYDCCLVTIYALTQEPPPCWSCGQLTGQVVLFQDGKHPCHSALRITNIGWEI